LWWVDSARQHESVAVAAGTCDTDSDRPMGDLHFSVDIRLWSSPSGVGKQVVNGIVVDIFRSAFGRPRPERPQSLTSGSVFLREPRQCSGEDRAVLDSQRMRFAPVNHFHRTYVGVG